MPSSPRTPGHEIIGDVAAVGPGESRWKVGARVGGTWHGGHDGTNLCLTTKPREIDGSLKAPANPAIEDFFKCAKTKRLMEPPVMEAVSRNFSISTAQLFGTSCLHPQS